MKDVVGVKFTTAPVNIYSGMLPLGLFFSRAITYSKNHHGNKNRYGFFINWHLFKVLIAWETWLWIGGKLRLKWLKTSFAA